MSSGSDNARWFRPAGTLATDTADVVVNDSIEGWAHTGLIVLTLGPGESAGHDLGDREAVVVPLSGAVTAEVDGATIPLAGRPDVFTAATDVLYAPPGSRVTLAAAAETGVSRVALTLAAVPTGAASPPVCHLSATEVPVELRGAGSASRLVRNFGIPGVLDASRIIVCEVVTPSGNWSSWPPHKHDEERPGEETELEEIYYFEARGVDERALDPVGYHRVYGSAQRPIDVLTEVRSGDVVLVPHGWHGPSVAAPDADLYYLNVMAGPGAERAWRICDDPAHGWVRESWDALPGDPRLTDTRLTGTRLTGTQGRT